MDDIKLTTGHMSLGEECHVSSVWVMSCCMSPGRHGIMGEEDQLVYSRGARSCWFFARYCSLSSIGHELTVEVLKKVGWWWWL